LDDGTIDGVSIDADAGPLGRATPVSICWSPIVHCNLDCPHCLDDKTLGARNSQHRRRLAKLIGASDLLGADISGGEPLLLKDLPILLNSLTEGGLAVSVTTNGWFLEESAVTLQGNVDAIRISLDGPDSKHHDKWRGTDSFDRAIAGLRRARQLDIPIQIQTVAMRSTARALQSLLNLAANEGVVGVTVLQMLPIGEGRKLADTEMLSDAELVHLTSRLCVPPGLQLRIRTRGKAAQFTVVRADGWIWRNDQNAMGIERKWPLLDAVDFSYERK
jgi:MoaA/NifB/PqqE/SkfB family radical SAM enzyme